MVNTTNIGRPGRRRSWKRLTTGSSSSNDGSLGIHNTAYAVGLLKASIANLTGDANNDGLPDSWQTNYFGSLSNPDAAPNAINNTNNVPNWMMYALGLDPTQSGITVPGGVVWMDGKTLVNSGVTNTIAIYTAAEIAFNTTSGQYLSDSGHFHLERRLAEHRQSHPGHGQLGQLPDADAEQRADVLPGHHQPVTAKSRRNTSYPSPLTGEGFFVGELLFSGSAGILPAYRVASHRETRRQDAGAASLAWSY